MTKELATIDQAINPDEVIDVEATQPKNPEPIDIGAEDEERPMSAQEFERCSKKMLDVVRESRAAKREKKNINDSFNTRLKSYELQIDIIDDAMNDRKFSRMEAVFDPKEIEKLRDAI